MLLAGVVEVESTFDIDLFASNLQEQAGDGAGGLSVEGYSYAISQRDLSDPFGTFETRYSNFVDVDGNDDDGVSRHAWDNASGVATSSNADRDQEIASISKSITAAAVLHVWQEQTASVDSLSTRLDDPIVQYLPTSDTSDSGYWDSSDDFKDITIRQILTHTSGLRSGGATSGSISGGLTNGYIYSDLQLIAEEGTVIPNSATPPWPSSLRREQSNGRNERGNPTTRWESPCTEPVAGSRPDQFSISPSH
jgi:hypothetical protein